MIRINNIILDIDEDEENIRKRAAKKLKISEKDFEKFKILRESIDARRKNTIKFNYSVEVKCKNEDRIISKIHGRDAFIEKDKPKEKFQFGHEKLKSRPVVIGMGPCGMFAALTLAQNGYAPIVIERGENVDDRTKTVDNFWKTGELNTESNVQFGEGGAGTFSDGKLTTRIKDSRCGLVLDEFVSCGAPEEITYSGKPHIGTDILKKVVKNIRKKIINLGGEIIFNSRLEDIIVKNNAICAVVVNGEEIPAECVILAVGHSSRDTYEMLYKKGVFLEPKPFAIGVRIEHPREFINESQYGKYKDHPRLKAADYRLSHTTKDKRGVYSFCMCPGGAVVASSSEQERLVCNGMSNYRRDMENSNAAIVVTVKEDDFKNAIGLYNKDISDKNPLIGMEFQRYYEHLAYLNGGGNYNAPIQLVGDFMKDTVSTKIGGVKPSYTPGYKFAALSKCLPSYVISSLKEGMIDFDKKITGFMYNDAVMTGIETRTSAPVKIVRGENLESISLQGLYPSGEGAGFAGGIISAAVDGIKSAESIMKKYKINI
ncbi:MULTISPECIES: NAD(P)/FAD-dependent oxidoreductase [Clostridium]|uniref:NAD(P)/FAD-dependent oxidoreductase n=1 Tax=Clostridium TaxID=1485 RepID=UPI00082465E5|nr:MULTISPECIES: NAD(P)/FAD-dependent oxidoreductase [Clostridium]PJI08928.1 NAD(P)/FAD-dependent oxidoreductase [Clostridium sp. CT7]